MTMTESLAKFKKQREKRGRPYYYLRSGVLHEVKPRDYGIDLEENESAELKDAVTASKNFYDKQQVLADYWRGLATGRQYNFDEKLDRQAQVKRVEARQ